MASLNIREVTERDKEQIERLTDLDTTSLYIELGQQLGVLGEGEEEAESSGRRFLNNRRPEIYDLVCIQGNYCQFISRNRNLAAIQIIASLAQFLAPVFGGFPVYTIATILFKLGLSEFCECSKRTQN